MKIFTVTTVVHKTFRIQSSDDMTTEKVQEMVDGDQVNWWEGTCIHESTEVKLVQEGRLPDLNLRVGLIDS